MKAEKNWLVRSISTVNIAILSTELPDTQNLDSIRMSADQIRCLDIILRKPMDG